MAEALANMSLKSRLGRNLRACAERVPNVVGGRAKPVPPSATTSLGIRARVRGHARASRECRLPTYVHTSSNAQTHRDMFIPVYIYSLCQAKLQGLGIILRHKTYNTHEDQQGNNTKNLHHESISAIARQSCCWQVTISFPWTITRRITKQPTQSPVRAAASAQPSPSSLRPLGRTSSSTMSPRKPPPKPSRRLRARKA